MITTIPCRIPDLPNKDYHALREFVSKSGLDKIHDSPLSYKHKYIDSGPDDDTDATMWGRALHHYVLEHDTFKDHYHIVGHVNVDGVAKVPRKNSKEWQAEVIKAGSKDLLKVTDLGNIVGAREAILNHPRASELLEYDGVFEHSFFGLINEVKVKCRPDKYVQSKGVIIDLKSTVSAKYESFQKSIANFRYHVQAAFYMDVLRACGYPANTFVFLAVEKNPPFHIGVYWLGVDAIEKGREEYLRNLALFKWCLKMNTWVDYNEDRAVEIDLPYWAYRD